MNYSKIHSIEDYRVIPSNPMYEHPKTKLQKLYDTIENTVAVSVILIVPLLILFI